MCSWKKWKHPKRHDFFKAECFFLFAFFFTLILFGFGAFFHIVEGEAEIVACNEAYEFYGTALETEVLNFTYVDRSIVDPILKEFEPTCPKDKAVTWSYWKSFNFGRTIVSTIGYGTPTELTPGGRWLVICMAFIGIPIGGIAMMQFFSLLGVIFSCCGHFRWVDTRFGKLLRREKGGNLSEKEKLKANKCAAVWRLVLLAVVWIAVTFGCAAIFAALPMKPTDVAGSGGPQTCGELPALPAVAPVQSTPVSTTSASPVSTAAAADEAEAPMFSAHWDYGTALYFSFITLTTIGLGDVTPAPQNGWATAFTFFFAFFGLKMYGMFFAAFDDLSNCIYLQRLHHHRYTGRRRLRDSDIELASLPRNQGAAALGRPALRIARRKEAEQAFDERMAKVQFKCSGWTTLALVVSAVVWIFLSAGVLSVVERDNEIRCVALETRAWETTYAPLFDPAAGGINGTAAAILRAHYPSTAKPVDGKHWDFLGGLFFVLTLVTTIGYGNFAPGTSGGRVLTVIAALVGIPLTGFTIINVFRFLRELLRRVIRWDFTRPGKISNVVDPTPKWRLAIHLGAVLLYILIGGSLLAPIYGWDDVPTAWYFTVVTLTTIGFGDLVPDTDFLSTLYSGIYIFFGLVLVAATIDAFKDLVRFQRKRLSHPDKPKHQLPETELVAGLRKACELQCRLSYELQSFELLGEDECSLLALLARSAMGDHQPTQTFKGSVLSIGNYSTLPAVAMAESMPFGGTVFFATDMRLWRDLLRDYVRDLQMGVKFRLRRTATAARKLMLAAKYRGTVDIAFAELSYVSSRTTPSGQPDIYGAVGQILRQGGTLVIDMAPDDPDAEVWSGPPPPGFLRVHEGIKRFAIFRKRSQTRRSRRRRPKKKKKQPRKRPTQTAVSQPVVRQVVPSESDSDSSVATASDSDGAPEILVAGEESDSSSSDEVIETAPADLVEVVPQVDEDVAQVDEESSGEGGTYALDLTPWFPADDDSEVDPSGTGSEPPEEPGLTGATTVETVEQGAELDASADADRPSVDDVV